MTANNAGRAIAALRVIRMHLGYVVIAHIALAIRLPAGGVAEHPAAA